MSKAGGFSLVELVIAVGIGAILMVATTSQLLYFTKSNQQNEELLGKLELRNEISDALAKDSTCNLNFSAANMTVTGQGSAPPTPELPGPNLANVDSTTVITLNSNSIVDASGTTLVRVGVPDRVRSALVPTEIQFGELKPISNELYQGVLQIKFDQARLKSAMSPIRVRRVIRIESGTGLSGCVTDTVGGGVLDMRQICTAIGLRPSTVDPSKCIDEVGGNLAFTMVKTAASPTADVVRNACLASPPPPNPTAAPNGWQLMESVCRLNSFECLTTCSWANRVL